MCTFFKFWMGFISDEPTKIGQSIQMVEKNNFEVTGFKTKPLWVSRVLKYPKKYLEDLTTFFMSTWWGDSKYVEEIEFSRWLFEGRLMQGKNVLPDGQNWLQYFTGSS